jgi:methionyl-tRNA formyltransferase
MPRVVFFGSPDFAVSSLKRLSQTRFKPEIVVTQPDRPAGRGRKIVPTAVRQAARELDIPVMILERFKGSDVMERVSSIGPDYFVVAAFGLIFPRSVLEMPSVGCLNVHASLLPAWRGASPINMAIAAGDSFSGITTMKMVKELDAGPIYMQRAIPVHPLETAGELSERLAALGGELIVETLERIEEGSIEPVPQKDEGISYAPMLKKKNGLIRWESGAVAVHNHIRGMNPWPGSYTGKGDTILKIHEARPLDLIPRDVLPGTVLDTSGEAIVVACGDGSLSITKIQVAGRKVLGAGEFLRGFELEVGDVLGRGING